MTNEGNLAFTAGASSVFGEFTNSASGTVVVSGGATVTFFSPVVQNGTFDVLTSSSAVLLSGMSGSGLITGGGTVTILGDPDLSGNHAMSAALVLDGDLVIGSGSSSLSGNVSGPGSLTLDGDGQLILSGSNAYTGGTVVSSGSLYVTNPEALPTGMALTVGGGGVVVFDPGVTALPVLASSAVVKTVPEPPAVALLGVGALAVLAFSRRRRFIGARRSLLPAFTSTFNGTVNPSALIGSTAAFASPPNFTSARIDINPKRKRGEPMTAECRPTISISG